VLVACLGQLRFAPSGHVIGLELSPALEIAAVRGSEPGVLSELLQAAEAGLIEAFNDKDSD